MGPYAGADYNLTPFVHSTVDSTTFTMDNPMPESTLTLCQIRLYATVPDYGFGLRIQSRSAVSCQLPMHADLQILKFFHFYLFIERVLTFEGKHFFDFFTRFETSIQFCILLQKYVLKVFLAFF
jgi:hypothetical protein